MNTTLKVTYFPPDFPGDVDNYVVEILDGPFSGEKYSGDTEDEAIRCAQYGLGKLN